MPTRSRRYIIRSHRLQPQTIDFYSYNMGGQQSKDEVIIAQSTNGNSNAQASQKPMNLSEILIILVVVLLLVSIAYYLHKKCRQQAVRVLRRELTRSHLANNNTSTFELPTVSA
ncbi:hypothetical protein B5X24_HaOG204538 [Helicoverpa armigera]|uniref:Uncharacterized protein n=1 Tax=Helicoverpa armigera TaxID=29058 RepID=A0A2W1BTE5_HELAM|nr:hypothetical protein B5X24_HaOG204538 [Helicoverpa armigera]